ncbi:hypothetical protein Sjap_008801 [Stephania japonica]|uniref:Uncharacterized protein n=1 Tax=Stephania japonica TaxID=461633 RepID=A0AAP0JQE3_9MAGN
MCTPDEAVEGMGHSSPSFYYYRDILVPSQLVWLTGQLTVDQTEGGACAPPCWGRRGELKLPSIGPLCPWPPAPTMPVGPPAVGQRATTSLVRPPSRRRKGGKPPLPSPLHGSYGVGEEEPLNGALTPPSGEDGVPLWGPHPPQQRRRQ